MNVVRKLPHIRLRSDSAFHKPEVRESANANSIVVEGDLQNLITTNPNNIPTKVIPMRTPITPKFI